MHENLPAKKIIVGTYDIEQLLRRARGGGARGANIEAKNSNDSKACGYFFFVLRAWITGTTVSESSGAVAL